jgi:hypothetical protein
VGRDDHGTVPVTVEVLLMGARDGRLTHRGVRGALASGDHPGALAALPEVWHAVDRHSLDQHASGPAGQPIDSVSQVGV